MEIARAEISTLLAKNRICLIALDENDTVVGLAGGLPDYDGNVWELHPLVVKKSEQGRGIGRRLVEAIERQARARGAVTMMLGTDDETGATSRRGRTFMRTCGSGLPISGIYTIIPIPFMKNAAIPLSGWCRMRTDTAARIS